MCVMSTLLSREAYSHPLNLAYAQLDLEGSGKASLRLQCPASTNVSAAKLMASVVLTTNGANCSAMIDERGNPVTSASDFSCAPGAITALRLALPALDEAPLGFQIVGRVQYEGDEQVFNLDLEHPDAEIHWDSSPSFKRFLMMGVRHIGAWPSEWYSFSALHFPAGIDHILFLLALLLGGGNLKRTLAMVTGFTVGHSITLALATFGLAHAPVRIVESAIALSIIYVAIEDFLRAAPQHRWQVATFFGLVHGLAFASALTEAHLQRGDMVKALIGFNVGVELGQATIVLVLTAAFLAVDRLAHPSARTKRRAMQAVAVLILIPATCWFVQRAFGG